MAIIRVQKNQNYTTINNTALKDNRLSFKAKGLMAYMLSVPDDWKFYQSELTNRATDGVSSIRSGLKELEEYGYLVRYQGRHDDTGEFQETVWDLYEMPKSEKRISVNPISEKPKSENETLLSTNELSTDEPSTKVNKKLSSGDDQSYSERFESLWKLYPEKKGSKKSAFNSYKKAVKKGTTDEEIKKGISDYKKHLKNNSWLNPAYGSTWFSQERWSNEYDVGGIKDKNDPDRYIPKELRKKENESERHRAVNEKHDEESSLESELDGFI